MASQQGEDSPTKYQNPFLKPRQLNSFRLLLLIKQPRYFRYVSLTQSNDTSVSPIKLLKYIFIFFSFLLILFQMYFYFIYFYFRFFLILNIDHIFSVLLFKIKKSFSLQTICIYAFYCSWLLKILSHKYLQVLVLTVLQEKNWCKMSQ